MGAEFEDERGTVEEPTDQKLLNEVAGFLSAMRPGLELRLMEQQMAEIITYDETTRYLRYKNFCLNELTEINQIPTDNGFLYSAIERGFIIGYWLAWQRFGQTVSQ